MRARKKSSEVKVAQHTGDTTELPYEMETAITRSTYGGSCFIDTPEGSKECHVGDWILRGDNGEFDVWKEPDFKAVYELIECVGAPDEPVFTVLGRDQLAQATVRFWINRAETANVAEEKIDRARRRYQEIVVFQSEHPERVKTPD